MFYKFNSLRGRLIPSSQGASINPQGLKALKIKESPLIFESQSINPAHVSQSVVHEEVGTLAKAAYTGPQLGKVPLHPRYQSVMALQELFLKNDGMLVWQKRGMRDRLPYAASVAICVIGSIFAFHSLYEMAFPQKSDD